MISTGFAQDVPDKACLLFFSLHIKTKHCIENNNNNLKELPEEHFSKEEWKGLCIALCSLEVEKKTHTSMYQPK